MKRFLDFIRKRNKPLPDTLELHKKRAENIGKFLEKHYNYDEHEKNIVNKYYYSSSGLNMALAHKSVPFSTERFQHENLEKMMKKYKTPHDLYVYTGIGENRENLIKGGGNIIHFPAYTSTSLSKGTAARFGKGALLKIHVPKGSAGLYLHTNEYEFILHHGAKIQMRRNNSPQNITYDKATQFRHLILTNPKKRIYHARLVHDGIKEV